MRFRGPPGRTRAYCIWRDSYRYLPWHGCAARRRGEGALGGTVEGVVHLTPSRSRCFTPQVHQLERTTQTVTDVSAPLVSERMCVRRTLFRSQLAS